MHSPSLRSQTLAAGLLAAALANAPAAPVNFSREVLPILPSLPSGWDHHGGLPKQIRRQCADVDRGCHALITDLKQRGLLEDTLFVWGGEFGRTNYSQGRLTATDYGRDHHPRCFTIWIAGGGVKPGVTYGATDEFGYNVVENSVSVHDLQATILHQLGIDHERLTFKHQGRYYRLTDVEGHVLKAVLS